MAIFNTDNWKLLSDVIYSHATLMKQFQGVVPEIASREHLKMLPLAIHDALGKAGLTLRDIDHFAVTNRPGLIGALLVGVTFAKALAYSLDKPFSTFCHIESHLFSPILLQSSDNPPPPFPWIALVVSGGHTELFLVNDYLDYGWCGGTLDDAAGEAFDKIGKILGFEYPAGPSFDSFVKAHATKSDRTTFEFPRARVPAYHFSYSGLKTAVSLKIKTLSKQLSHKTRVALSACAQEAIIDPLVKEVNRACNEFEVSNVAVTGGVACNTRLREKLPNAYFPEPRYCSDNAAMVACLAAIYQRCGRLSKSCWTDSARGRVEFKPVSDKPLRGVVPV